ncbi:hypothetical protein [Halocynthiibacter sp.]|uniref:hypothetical protein n=1 Tax=Halocynthiibacter sp. TaxID=1979210 RepID=UPI003C58C044
MKIKCACGDIIPDQTDYLSYKAHVIGDKNFFDFLDAIDDAIVTDNPDKEFLMNWIRKLEPGRLAWECLSCGRLYFDGADRNLVEYLPGNKQVNHIFDRER